MHIIANLYHPRLCRFQSTLMYNRKHASICCSWFDGASFASGGIVKDAGINQLRALQSDQLPASAVFDVEKYGLFLALVDADRIKIFRVCVHAPIMSYFTK